MAELHPAFFLLLSFLLTIELFYNVGFWGFVLFFFCQSGNELRKWSDRTVPSFRAGNSQCVYKKEPGLWMVQGNPCCWCKMSARKHRGRSELKMHSGTYAFVYIIFFQIHHVCKKNSVIIFCSIKPTCNWPMN